MNIKARLRNYGLWVAVAALVLIVLQTFGVPVVEADYYKVFYALMSVLVLLGIVIDPTTPGIADGSKVSQDAVTIESQANQINGEKYSHL